MSIPRIIHQIFFDGWHALPDETKEAIQELKGRNPSWEYRFYDQEAAVEFIREHFDAETLGAFQAIDVRHYAARADLLRYLICYVEGGVYLDIKSTALLPLDDVIESNDQFVLSQWPELRDLPASERRPQLQTVPGEEYVQWFLISSKRNEFLSAVIDRVLKNIRVYRPIRDGIGRVAVLSLSGPFAFSLAVYQLRSSLPHRYVDFEEDLGLLYSIHGDHGEHKKKYNKHYSNLKCPVIKQGVLQAALCAAWYRVGKPVFRYFGWKPDRLPKRVRRLLSKLSS